MASWIKTKRIELTDGTPPEPICVQSNVGDAYANKIILRIYENNAAKDLTDHTASSQVERVADGVGVLATGTIDNNEITFTFPAACYAYAGTVKAPLVLANATDGSVTTLVEVQIDVKEAGVDTFVDPGESLTLSALAATVAQMETDVDAKIAEAETAITNAGTATSSATGAAETALSAAAEAAVSKDMVKRDVTWSLGWLDTASGEVLSTATRAVSSRLWVAAGTVIHNASSDYTLYYATYDETSVFGSIVSGIVDASTVVAADCYVILGIEKSGGVTSDDLDAIAEAISVYESHAQSGAIALLDGTWELPGYEWEQGWLSSGSEFDTTSQLRSTVGVYMPSGTQLRIVDESGAYKFYAVCYSPVTGAWIKNLGSTRGILTLDADYIVRVGIPFYSSVYGTVMPSDSAGMAAIGDMVRLYKSETVRTAEREALVFTDNGQAWEFGSISGGAEWATEARIRTELMALGAGTVLKLYDPTYMVTAALYGTAYNFKLDPGWRYPTYTIPYDCYARLILRRSDGAVISSGDIAAMGAALKIAYKPPMDRLYLLSAASLPVPDYYVDHLAERVGDAEAAQRALGRGGDTVLFVTDLHYVSGTPDNLPNLVKAITEDMHIGRVIINGDIITGGTNDAMLATLYEHQKRMRPVARIYNAMGNHDYNPYGGTGQQITWDEYFSAVQTDVAEDVVWSGLDTIDYYFDVTARKLRYIILDTASDTSPTDADQLQWLANVALDIGAGWSAVLITHHLYNYSMTTAYGLAEVMFAILAAWDAGASYVNATYGVSVDYSAAHGQVLCVIMGDAHYDNYKYWGGIPLVMTDSYVNNHLNSGGTADAGSLYAATYREHAMDVVNLDPSGARSYMTRVGKGVSRTFNAGARAVAVSGTLALTPTISGTLTWASSDTGKATVADGTVTGVAAGAAVITATDADGNFEAWAVAVA